MVTSEASRAGAGAAPRDALVLADGRELPLLRDDLSIGRAPTNAIVLDDETILPRQARLVRFPEGWVLGDLASSAGTAVNGQPVTYPVVLAPGDTIRLGRLELAFQSAGAAGAYRRGETREQFAQPGACLVEIRDVVKTYPAAAGPVRVLHGVSLSVRAGEFVAILGPSGCGKSTLLNLITGIDRPDAGEVIVAGQDLQRLSSDALARWRGRTVGIVFQFFQLLPTLTVAENVMLPMAFCHTFPGRERRARTLEVLRQVGLERMADRLPSALSGGEQQRVAIARALANDPPLLVADEPTGNLDARTGRQIFNLFAQLVAAGTTVLMVTHDPTLAREVPRCVEMVDGSVVGTA